MSKKKYNIGSLKKLKILIKKHGEEEGRKEYQRWYQKRYNNLPEPKKKREDAVKRHYDDNFKHIQRGYTHPRPSIDYILTEKNLIYSPPEKLILMLERIKEGIVKYRSDRRFSNGDVNDGGLLKRFLTTEGNPRYDLYKRKQDLAQMNFNPNIENNNGTIKNRK